MINNLDENESLVQPDEMVAHLRACIEGSVEPLQPFSSYPCADLVDYFSSTLFMERLGFAAQREKFVRTYGHVLLTAECRDALVSIVSERKVLDVGSGAGFLSFCLRQADIDVVALDKILLHEPWPQGVFLSVWALDCIGSVESAVVGLYDVILMAWPPHGDPFAYNVAQRMCPGQVLIYQGEGPGGCTADDDFFDYLATAEWEMLREESFALNDKHKQFPNMRDRWLVARKLSTQ